MTWVTETESVTPFAFFSFGWLLPMTPMKEKDSLYLRLEISCEPIASNHFLHSQLSWLAHSSWHAATTMCPSGMTASLMNSSNELELAYVSNTLEYSTALVLGLTTTICNPL